MTTFDLKWTEFALKKLRDIDSPYLPFAHAGLEWQFKPVEGNDDALDRWASQWPFRASPDDKRVPKDGDGEKACQTENKCNRQAEKCSAGVRKGYQHR